MLTHDDMAHLARLARLAPAETDLTRFGQQCDAILHYMDSLNTVDTHNTPPLYSPIQQAATTRPDVVVQHHERQDVLVNAPESDGTFFIVPRIV